MAFAIMKYVNIQVFPIYELIFNILGKGSGVRIAAYPSFGACLPNGTFSLPNSPMDTVRSLMTDSLPERWAHQNTGNKTRGNLRFFVFLICSDDYKLNPLYPEIHLPLNVLGLLLHGLYHWDSKYGVALRQCLWSAPKEAGQELIRSMTFLDFEYVRAIVKMQQEVIPKIAHAHYRVASLLNLETGNFEMDF